MNNAVKSKVSRPEVNAGTLLAWRGRMGYSQRDACQALGCSRAALGAWETGLHKVPRYIGLACAALALGMTEFGGAADKELVS